MNSVMQKEIIQAERKNKGKKERKKLSKNYE